jgi:polyhydroxyalkanoate synthase
VRFLLAGSGHIAGVINPPSANKYNYWMNEEQPDDLDEWINGATSYPGSWWNDWHDWLQDYSGELVEARVPGEGGLPALEEAPGSYVRK